MDSQIGLPSPKITWLSIMGFCIYRTPAIFAVLTRNPAFKNRATQILGSYLKGQRRANVKVYIMRTRNQSIAPPPTKPELTA